MSEPSESASGQDMYLVVMNHEQQYSIWPSEKQLPAGWKSEGTSGTRDECLGYIDRVWVDMRPLSIREALEEGGDS